MSTCWPVFAESEYHRNCYLPCTNKWSNPLNLGTYRHRIFSKFNVFLRKTLLQKLFVVSMRESPRKLADDEFSGNWIIAQPESQFCHRKCCNWSFWHCFVVNSQLGKLINHRIDAVKKTGWHGSMNIRLIFPGFRSGKSHFWTVLSIEHTAIYIGNGSRKHLPSLRKYKKQDDGNT